MKHAVLAVVTILFSLNALATSEFILEPKETGDFIEAIPLSDLFSIEQIEHQFELDVLKDEKEYKWLFDKLMPQKWAQLDEAKKSFYKHLKDSLRFFPDPDEIQESNLIRPIEHLPLTGRITYAGFFRKKYKHDVTEDKNGDITIEVRVHFKKAAEDKFQLMSERIEAATQLWNASRVDVGFNYKFSFKAVRDKKDAHYSVRLKSKTRGPYDSVWSYGWTPPVIAHEIGHMLGLGDEYQTVSGKIDCLKQSLMCHAWRGKLQGWHYYHVLRRLLPHKFM